LEVDPCSFEELANLDRAELPHLSDLLRIIDDRVEIVRIIHGARDLEAALLE
jgi:hypothetical protein